MIDPKIITFTVEIIKPSTGSLVPSECFGTIVSNFGQSAENTLTLPPAEAGLNFVLVVSTVGAGALHLKASPTDKFYLNGTAIDDGDKISCSVPAIGNSITIFAFRTGASSWDWIAEPISGVWTDGGA